MPAAKVFDQSSKGAIPTSSASANNVIPVSLVSNPIKIASKKNEKTEEEKQKDLKKAQELSEYRDKLEDELIKKLDELKKVCLQEAEIRGILPPEIYLTLHPDEPAPTIKRKVGTAFIISEDVLANINTDDKLALLETDIKVQKEIIAATEKMAKDKYINKSLRKKHRRDLQSAHGKLRNLQKGLNKMRLSLSKPDVSNLHESLLNGGSAYSLNAQKLGWYDNPLMSDPLSAKSCPTTPRGSIRDLSEERNSIRLWDQERSPSLTSISQIHKTSRSSIITNTSPNDSGIHSGTAESSPPSVPSRRMTVSSNRDTINQQDDGRIYENIGYNSVQPYVSAYRQHHFPTINNQQMKPEIIEPMNNNNKKLKTSISAHFPKMTNMSTNFGTKSYSSLQFKNLTEKEQLTSAAHNQLGHILKKINNNENILSNHRLSMITPTTNSATRLTTSPLSSNKGFSTSSLDRRLLRQRQNKNENDNLPSTSNGFSPIDSKKLTTTFPVGSKHEQMASDSTSHESSFSSQRNGIGYGVPHCTVNPRHRSATRIPPNDWHVFESLKDPQMEALLNHYKDGVFSKNLTVNPVHNSTPTTRIVPIEKKNNNKNINNGATMV